MARARELLDDINCESLVLSDNHGERVAGIRLQLKLGMTAI